MRPSSRSVSARRNLSAIYISYIFAPIARVNSSLRRATRATTSTEPHLVVERTPFVRAQQLRSIEALSLPRLRCRVLRRRTVVAPSASSSSSSAISASAAARWRRGVRHRAAKQRALVAVRLLVEPRHEALDAPGRVVVLGPLGAVDARRASPTPRRRTNCRTRERTDPGVWDLVAAVQPRLSREARVLERVHAPRAPQELRRGRRANDSVSRDAAARDERILASVPSPHPFCRPFHPRHGFSKQSTPAAHLRPPKRWPARSPVLQIVGVARLKRSDDAVSWRDTSRDIMKPLRPAFRGVWAAGLAVEQCQSLIFFRSCAREEDDRV